MNEQNSIESKFRHTQELMLFMVKLDGMTQKKACYYFSDRNPTRGTNELITGLVSWCANCLC